MSHFLSWCQNSVFTPLGTYLSPCNAPPANHAIMLHNLWHTPKVLPTSPQFPLLILCFCQLDQCPLPPLKQSPSSPSLLVTSVISPLKSFYLGIWQYFCSYSQKIFQVRYIPKSHLPKPNDSELIYIFGLQISNPTRWWFRERLVGFG